MLEDFRLQVFIAVCSERSFTKAAAQLGISQPAVSQNIAELERVVGMKLFARLRGEVALTGEGVVFKDYAEKLLASCSSLDDMFARLPACTVRISATEELYTYMVSPALESFSKIHPEIVFERALFEDADLVISLKPVSGRVYDVPADSIARIRMSIFPTPSEPGVMEPSSETTSYFDVLYHPTPLFSCTRLCRLIRDFMVK